MTNNALLKLRIYFTAITAIVIWSLLFWDYAHGGVPIHHLLQRADMPSFSNWWGGVLIPVLTWFLLKQICKRIPTNTVEKVNFSAVSNNIYIGFFASLAFGIILSALFSFDVHDIPGYMLLALLPLALFFPIYRAECLLGFVLGMMFTFGGVLPVLIGSIFAAIYFIIFKVFRTAIIYLFKKISER